MVRMQRLGDVCAINPRLPRDHGLANDTSVSFVPMAAIGEISGTIEAATTRRYGDVKKGYTAFSDGDVLFAKITPCMENGKAALATGLAGGHGFGSTEFHVLRARESVLAEWIYYFVRRESFRREAKRNFTGTAGQQRVPASFLHDTLIPVPPLAEQRRIVDLLARAEGIVRLRREAQQKAAELIPAIFIDMFGDPSTNPMQWPAAKLGQLLAEPPVLGTMLKPTATPGSWLDLRVANIQGGELTLTDKKWVELKAGEIDRFALRDGDLLLARAIGSLDHLGKAVVIEQPGAWTFDSHLMRVRCNRSALLPQYLKSFLKSPGGRTEFLKHTRRSAVQFNINGKELRQLSIPLPPIAEQILFASRIRDVESIGRRQVAASARALTTFDAILSKAFSVEGQQIAGR
ncbi:MAG: restriction endonuclease subunit S [Phycisphaerales bacterium]